MPRYIITDAGDPDWDQVVEMTPAQAAVLEAAGYTVGTLNDADVLTFEQFRAEYLDD